MPALVSCDAQTCHTRSRMHHTGRYVRIPDGWWTGRAKKWPKPVSGEIYACSTPCVRELQKGGHRGLFWYQASKEDRIKRQSAGKEEKLTPEALRARARALSADETNQWFQLLRAERWHMAQEAGVKAYIIASDAQLHELIALQPENLEQLQVVSGIGAAKAGRYGDRLVELITELKRGDSKKTVKSETSLQTLEDRAQQCALTADQKRSLLDQLRAERMQAVKHRSKALPYRLPAYLIARDTELQTIVDYLPVTPKELNLLRGWGPAKTERAGFRFLNVVTDFLDFHGLTGYIADNGDGSSATDGAQAGV